MINTQNSTQKKKNKNDFLLEMNEKDKEINHKIIKNMNKRVNYLKNPRFKINKAPVLFQYINTKQDIVTTKDSQTYFRIDPRQIIFRDYMLDGIYEITLYATNATPLLQRIKLLPPEKPEFQISSIQYPSPQDGYIAPGMSAIIKIRFHPSSLAEFDDQIAILSEDHILKIPLLARKEPPQLDLPASLDCQSCWLGDQVETKFVVTNTGGEAGYRFFLNANANQSEEDNFVQIGNFYLQPAEFFLHKGETKTIEAIFKPDNEGEVIENIILGCDNLTQSTLKLIGKGNIVELGISGIDDTNLETAIEQLQKIFFCSPIPNQITTRKLKIRNKTSVKVKYHWSLSFTDKEFQLADETNYYQIQPQGGYFQPNDTIEFNLMLKSEEYFPLFQNAYLIIDEIPFESIRNPPPHLKAQFENQSSQVTIGMNSTKQSISYFEFELISKSLLSTVTVTPPFQKFPNPICLSTLAVHQFTLISNREYPLKYSIHSMHKDAYIPTEFGILKQQEIITLGLQSNEIGHKLIEYRIDFDYADSVYITLIANVISPTISIKQSWINYGLIQTYSLIGQEITITNTSQIVANVKADSMQDHRLIFNRDILEIAPNQSIEFKVEFNSREAETYHDFMSFTVEGGECTVLEVFAEIQNPSVSLNRLSLEIETLYCGNTYTFDQRAQQYIKIENLGNIPTPYEWQIPLDNEKYLVQFEPRRGTLKPKSEQIIKFSIKPKLGGPLNELFVCEVQGLQYPLGFEMKTMIYGLSVEYELVDDSSHVSSKTSVSSKGKNTKDSRKSLLKADTEMKNQIMDKLEFYNCTINQPKQAKFLIKNTSGIHTQFNLSMKKFQPHALEEQSTLHDDFDAKSAITRTIKFAESSISKSISKKGKLTQSGRPVVLLTNKLEKTHNFSSEQGLQLIKQKKLDHDQRVYLSNNLGLAVVFEPASGTINAYGSVVVQVTLFNDICGFFEDQMCCDIRGLPIKEFPVAIDVKGSPIIISPSQLGFTYKGDFPSFQLGTFMRNSGTISKDFRVMNTGPQDIELEWKIYNMGGNEIQDLFDIKITDPALGSDQVCDVQFIAREPTESKEGPYQVTPQREKIRGRKEKHFTLHFSTSAIGVYNACLVAHPKLVKEEKSIGEVALYVGVSVLIPELHFDKLEKLEGGHQVKFQKWSSGPCLKQKKRLVLVNRQPSNLVCTFEIDGPFKLLKTSTNSPQKYEFETKSEIQKTFNLQTGSHVELEIFFEGFLPTDPVNWPLTYKVYHHGTVTIYFANGDKQTINLEGILLRPYVHLNTSGLDNVEGPDVLDFGEVQEQKIFAIYLSNLSLVPAKWTLQHEKNPLRKNIVEKTMTLEDKEEMIKTDDPTVFEFQMSQGLLDGPSTMVHTLPHATCLPHQITIEDIQDLGIQPFKIMIRFKPKKELMYKSKYRIRVQDGPSVDFILRGTGKDLIIRTV